MSDSVRPHRQQPTRLPRPWDSPGKNTGVGCRFLLQSMKVKSESEVALSFPTPSNPRDCSPPGSSAHEIFQARVLEWVAIAFSNSRLPPEYSCQRGLFLSPSCTRVACRILVPQSRIEPGPRQWVLTTGLSRNSPAWSHIDLSTRSLEEKQFPSFIRPQVAQIDEYFMFQALR